VQGGVEAAGGEPAADVGHGADRDAHLVGDLLLGVAGVGAEQDLGPVPLSPGQWAGLPSIQVGPLVLGQLHDISLRHRLTSRWARLPKRPSKSTAADY